MRYPTAAGKFYESDEMALRKQIEQCYLHPLGPGSLPPPVSSKKGNIVGLVAPHAGFIYSGHIAAHAYSALAADGWPDVFFVIGPNHTGFGPALATTEHDFKTPLGVAKVQKDVHDMLVSSGVASDIGAHRFEHSVEVQLPFLQCLGSFEFVPIVMMSQSHETAKKLGALIREASQGKNIVVIASTDMSHYVSREVARQGDSLAIDRIEEGDSKGLFELVKRTGLSMCGYGPVMAMLEATQAKKATLLAYANSGDVHAMKDVVGYAAMKVEV